MAASFSIRPFRLDEWRELKAIRLEALQKENGKFGSSFEEYNAQSDDEWRKYITRERSIFFALRHDNEIIGMTGVRLKIPDTASFVASYIRSEYRGKGLSGMLYQARIDWARSQGAERAITGYRASNIESKSANQKFGFVYLETEKDVEWPDGTTEDYFYCELKL